MNDHTFGEKFTTKIWTTNREEGGRSTEIIRKRNPNKRR
jgi:hypothetical protein